MKLYLHIGTEKTGSSFIQSLLTRNRLWLRNHGIHFPYGGKWEKEMEAGRISPGNGEELYFALQKRMNNPVEYLLRSSIEEAQRNECRHILISNERLLEIFADQKIFTLFKQLCLHLKLELAPMLMIVRDPVDQALSLYKHRAKSGNIRPLESWIKEDYLLAGYLEKFFLHLEDFPEELLFRKYQKDSNYLTQIFFQEWLELLDLPVVEDKMINPSLTLSELVLVKQLRKQKPSYTSILYQSFLSLPQSNKSDDRYLKHYYRLFLSNYLAQFEKVWQKCNQYLPPTEQISIPKIGDVSIEKEQILSFSPGQTAILIKFLAESHSFSFQIRLLLKKVRPVLARIKWWVLSHSKT